MTLQVHFDEYISGNVSMDCQLNLYIIKQKLTDNFFNYSWSIIIGLVQIKNY